jgi:Fe(3+) dicitrate transport protein
VVKWLASVSLLFGVGLAWAQAPEDSFSSGEEVIEVEGTTTPGSDVTVDQEELERFERDDIHKVLSSVPGVYIREEDGYGLRPNIGMRGASSDRSAKIALLEDGVLIAPAPYSAPAAYYFPLVTRMSRVEVLKGPSAIVYGPNTVGGAINMVSRTVPDHRTTFVDIAGGQDLYGKVHVGHAEAGPRFGVMIEAAKLRSDGFKEIDGGGDTGFDKNDIRGRLRWNSNPSAPRYHRLDVSLGYSDEDSNETYTGLSQHDFAQNPYRRYAGTRLDRFVDDHQQVVLGYEFENGGGLRIATQAYHLRFDRVWRRLNSFDGDVALFDVLANPDQGNNQIYYSVLTGATDSIGDVDRLLLRNNDRAFLSQGVQTTLTYERSLFGLHHELTAGLRLHRDRARRLHTEEAHLMQGGRLVRDGSPDRLVLDATGAARALAAFARDKVTVGPVEISAGLRFEAIHTEWRDRGAPTASNRELQTVLVPGAGLFYQALPWLGLFGGVHKGFVPAAPVPTETGKAEESVNYEVGFRAEKNGQHAEVTGFFNDYENLKGTCSAGCMEEAEFPGGAVHMVGVEARVAAEWFRGRLLSVPAEATYTFTRSEFLTGFRSDNPQWGTVDPGDELPYLPAHQVSATVGVRHAVWDVYTTGRFTGAMRDIAGAGMPDPEHHVPKNLVFDVATHVTLGSWGQFYATLQNVFDEATVVSLRPFGARPGAPRRIIAGYKVEF